VGSCKGLNEVPLTRLASLSLTTVSILSTLTLSQRQWMLFSPHYPLYGICFYPLISIFDLPNPMVLTLILIRYWVCWQGWLQVWGWFESEFFKSHILLNFYRRIMSSKLAHAWVSNQWTGKWIGTVEWTMKWTMGFSCAVEGTISYHTVF